MANTYVDFNYLTVSNVASMSVPLPANAGTPTPPRDGQLMLLYINWLAVSGTVSTSVSGWTSIISGASTGHQVDIYYKAGDGSVGDAVIVFSGGNAGASAFITLWDGSATVSPVDISGNNADSATASHSNSGVTTTAAGDVLVASWSGSEIETGFNAPGMTTIVEAVKLKPPLGGSLPGYPTTIAYDLLGVAGATGPRTANSYNSLSGAGASRSCNMNMVAIKAFNGPSAPVITAPVTGETITVGRTYSITWTASTDPVIAQSALTYALDYSLNNGLSWTSITAATSAGATTQSWNTTAILPSTQVLIRARAYNGTTNSAYYTTGQFTLAADATPGAPTSLHGEQPDGTTVTLFDLAQSLLIKGVFNDLGDVMTAFDVDWGTDGVTYGHTSTTTSSTFSKTFSGATFSAGLVYFRSRTKDNAGTYGAYATCQLTAANAPAAPNITAPTASVPPNRPLPTISWTSTAQVKYRITILDASGTTVYAGAFVTSSIQSIPSPYSFLNARSYTLQVDYQDASGLTSPKDSETFVVSYAGPLKPSIAIA